MVTDTEDNDLYKKHSVMRPLIYLEDLDNEDYGPLEYPSDSLYVEPTPEPGPARKNYQETDLGTQL